MNSLPINSKNKTTEHKTKSHKENVGLKSSLEKVSQELVFFLNKRSEEFTRVDLQKFEQVSKQFNNLVDENKSSIFNKLFEISSNLYDKDTSIEESTKTKDDLVKSLPKLPLFFNNLSSLINEIIEDESEEEIPFLKILLEQLITIDNVLQNKDYSVDEVYSLLSETLEKLQEYNITQQKYIYRTIGNSINQKITNYNFISPEDGDFVDNKFHKIVSGTGQRIARGLSYILLDANTEEVMKLGNVKVK